MIMGKHVRVCRLLCLDCCYQRLMVLLFLTHLYLLHLLLLLCQWFRYRMGVREFWTFALVHLRLSLVFHFMISKPLRQVLHLCKLQYSRCQVFCLIWFLHKHHCMFLIWGILLPINLLKKDFQLIWENHIIILLLDFRA